MLRLGEGSMTDDELTVLMIASQGESMIPIGRWEKPIRDLTAQGFMRCNDSANYVITEKGCAAVRQEETAREDDFKNALAARRGQTDKINVDMTVANRQIKFDLTYDPGFTADVCTVEFLRFNGACEPETVHLMRRVLREGDFAIDGGANIGFFTMVMSRLVGEQGHVEAFEPATVNFTKLRANLHLNRADNVTAINRGLWSEDTDLTLHIAADTGLSSLMPFDDAITRLPVRGLTLDKWCGNYDQPCRLLKLDIEGAEEHALIGAQEMLRKGIDFISCEINERALANFGSSQMDLRDYMAGKGYSAFMLHDDGRLPTQLKREDRIVGSENTNMLFSTEEKVHAAWGQVLT